MKPQEQLHYLFARRPAKGKSRQQNDASVRRRLEAHALERDTGMSTDVWGPRDPRDSLRSEWAS